MWEYYPISSADLTGIVPFFLNLFCMIGETLNRQENMARKAAGEEPLPEEDLANPIFKPIPEPSRLDSYLITNQISNYCNQINGYSLSLSLSVDLTSKTEFLIRWRTFHD
jgi:C-terminal region of eIF3h